MFDKSEDGGFVDADFIAQSIETSSDGVVSIAALSHSGSEEVGFLVVIPTQWVPWKPKDLGVVWYRGTVTIKSAGKSTEAFVRALAKAYGKAAPPFALTERQLTAIALGGDPRNAYAGKVELKLFCESERENEYAEIYLNFDLSKRVVELHEKDPEYRVAVLKFFSEKPANLSPKPTPTKGAAN